MVRLLLVVTGASRGLGRCITKAFHEQLQYNDDKNIESISCHLIARSAENLEQTRQEILETIDERRNNRRTSDDNDGDGCALQTQISIHPMDVGDLSTLEERMGAVFEEMASSTNNNIATDFDRFVLINNHGTLGHLGPAASLDDARTPSSLEDMQRAVNLNVTSCLWISVMASRFVQKHRGSSTAASATIVNISSLAAVQAFPTMAIYAAGKAVREKLYNQPALVFLFSIHQAYTV
jgi:NAD(P)-dependent dehydrogenase (short-subunit alcohol dehydrogenase family)